MVRKQLAVKAVDISVHRSFDTASSPVGLLMMGIYAHTAAPEARVSLMKLMSPFMHTAWTGYAWRRLPTVVLSEYKLKGTRKQSLSFAKPAASRVDFSVGS